MTHQISEIVSSMRCLSKNSKMFQCATERLEKNFNNVEKWPPLNFCGRAALKFWTKLIWLLPWEKMHQIVIHVDSCQCQITLTFIVAELDSNPTAKITPIWRVRTPSFQSSQIGCDDSVHNGPNLINFKTQNIKKTKNLY